MLRLPAKNSIARYCHDWKPEDWPSDRAELGVFAGRHGPEHIPRAGELLEDAGDAGKHLEGGLQPVLADRLHRRADLVDGELHPELRGLVLDDEEQLVMRRRQRLLRVEHALEMQVIAIGHAPGERHLRAFLGGIVGLAAHVTNAFFRYSALSHSRSFMIVLEDIDCAQHLLLADIERREAEADGVRGAEIADHVSCDQRLHDGVALGVAERDLAAARMSVARGCEREVRAARLPPRE